MFARLVYVTVGAFRCVLWKVHVYVALLISDFVAVIVGC